MSGLVSAGLCSYVGAFFLRWPRPWLGFVYGAGVATTGGRGPHGVDAEADADVKDLGTSSRATAAFSIVGLASSSSRRSPSACCLRLAPAGAWVA